MDRSDSVLSFAVWDWYIYNFGQGQGMEIFEATELKQHRRPVEPVAESPIPNGQGGRILKMREISERIRAEFHKLEEKNGQNVSQLLEEVEAWLSSLLFHPSTQTPTPENEKEASSPLKLSQDLAISLISSYLVADNSNSKPEQEPTSHSPADLPPSNSSPEPVASNSNFEPELEPASDNLTANPAPSDFDGGPVVEDRGQDLEPEVRGGGGVQRFRPWE